MPKAKITSKGQITLPAAVRRSMGLRPGDEIEFVEDKDELHIRKCIGESPFAKYRGDLTHLAGVDADALIEEMRGR